MKKFSVFVCVLALLVFGGGVVHAASGRSSGLWKHFRHYHGPIGCGSCWCEGHSDVGSQGHDD